MMSNSIYKASNSDLTSLPIKLLYATKSKYEKDWHSTMHMHPFTEIFYVIKGDGVFKVENTQIKVTEDDLVIVNSNVRHTESSFGKSPLEYIVLGFEGMSLIANRESGTENEIALGYSKYNFKAHKTQVLFFMELIHKELDAKKDYHDIIAHNLLQVLIMNIIRNTGSKEIMTTSEECNKEVSYVKKYIDINFSEDLNLDYLAALVFINKYSLIREFKKYIGTSPIEYLIQKRLTISKDLLETTDHSMKQISQIVGFSSQSYFNQAFKKRFEITPGLYRVEFNNLNRDNTN